MKLIVSLLTIIVSTSVLASPLAEITEDNPVCYGREYSEKHMEKHPSQTVKRFLMKFRETEWTEPEDFTLEIEAKVKVQEGYKGFSSSMYCHDEGRGKFSCSIDCDGGTARINWAVDNSNGYMVFKNEGFVLSGHCEDGDVENSIWLDPKKGGDDIFHLYPIRSEFCQN